MKIIIKLSLFSMGILLALLCVNSCMTPVPPALTIAVSPDSGHPPFQVIIAAACSEEGGTYTLFVEGENPVGSIEGAFSATVDDWPWKAVITWSDETGAFSEVPVVVSLENATPIAHQLFTVPNVYAFRSVTLIDLRYRPVGCVALGEPDFYVGIEDPDYTGDGFSMENDGFEYNVEIIDVASGTKESVFYGPNRTLMMPGEYVVNPMFNWIVGYSGYVAPFPFATPSAVSSLGCGIENPALTPAATSAKQIRVSVKEWGSIRRWEYMVFAGAAGCLP